MKLFDACVDKFRATIPPEKRTFVICALVVLVLFGVVTCG